MHIAVRLYQVSKDVKTAWARNASGIRAKNVISYPNQDYKGYFYKLLQSAYK